MNLGNRVEWALHCCSVLALRRDGAFTATKDLAAFHGVPKEYLSKALQSLAAAGILEGTLGPRGGYRLARAPSRVSFLDIVEAVEGRRSTFACTEIRAANPCARGAAKPKGPCAVARVMAGADAAWRRELGSVSLEDLHGSLVEDLGEAALERTAGWLGDQGRG